MKVYNIADVEFSEYGKVLSDYNFKAIFQELSKLKIPNDGMFHDGSLNLIKEAEKYMMNDNVWQKEPRKISTGPLADAEIFDRSKG